MSNSIQSKTLVDKVVELFLKRVERGELKPGRLPSQEVLAHEFNVSRTILREALTRLSTVDIVEIKHGKGTFLKKEQKGLIPQSLTSKLFFEDKDNLISILETRLILETEAAALAAQRIDNELLDKLETLIIKMGESFENHTRFGELDLTFHITIGEATKNKVLNDVIIFLENGYRMAPAKFYKIPGVMEKAHEEHMSIFKAIKEKNATLASDLMKKHLLYPEQILTKMKDNY